MTYEFSDHWVIFRIDAFGLEINYQAMSVRNACTDREHTEDKVVYNIRYSDL